MRGPDDEGAPFCSRSHRVAGSHQRIDRLQRDDGCFLKHTLADYTAGALPIDYVDVMITRWLPTERVYGR